MRPRGREAGGTSGDAAGPTLSRPAGAGLIRLYPTAWRARYAAEMLATLEQRRIGLGDRFDLGRGALDAWLHQPSRVPAFAALGAGGLWAVAGTVVVAQPVPPDWPGYLLETLPAAVLATILGGIATIGCWARRSDVAGRAGVLAVAVAIVGHVAWIAVLGAAWLGVGYGAPTIAAQAAGALGSVLVGLVLLRSADERIGALLVIAPAIMLLGWPVAWLGFGLAWTLVGVLLLALPAPDEPLASGFA
jgi:hypothetical protein